MGIVCPFCGRDPYHYVDIGVGMEAVAVTCCELGVELFDHSSTGDITFSREEFYDLANKIRDLRANALDNEALREALNSALSYCDCAMHPTEQYNDERPSLYRHLEKARE